MSSHHKIFELEKQLSEIERHISNEERRMARFRADRVRSIRRQHDNTPEETIPAAVERIRYKREARSKSLRAISTDEGRELHVTPGVADTFRRELADKLGSLAEDRAKSPVRSGYDIFAELFPEDTSAWPMYDPPVNEWEDEVPQFVDTDPTEYTDAAVIMPSPGGGKRFRRQIGLVSTPQTQEDRRAEALERGFRSARDAFEALRCVCGLRASARFMEYIGE